MNSYKQQGIYSFSQGWST